MIRMQKPTIFKFIDFLKAEESLARSRVLKCGGGQEPPKRKKKYIVRDDAIKKSLLAYLKVREELSIPSQFFHQFFFISIANRQWQTLLARKKEQ